MEAAMTYRISPLDRAHFAPLFAMDDEELAQHAAIRVVADADRGYPCRIALDDARSGDRLILMNYASPPFRGPYATRYAIYVGEASREPEPFIDRLPPCFNHRALSLRAFGSDELVVTARLAEPGNTDSAIGDLLADDRVVYIMAHYAAYGCFAARIDRHGY
jgi:hypothetical protein